MALKRSIFIDQIRDGKTMRRACEAAGLQQSTVSAWRKAEPEFEALYLDAEADGVDLVEEHLLQRVTGDKPSDLLTMFYLKSRRPALYRD